MKIFTILLILLFSMACNNKSLHTETVFTDLTKTEDIKFENKIHSKSIERHDSENEVMEEDDVLFNGKLRRFFTIEEFENVFGKVDSAKLMSAEAPCSYIFENEDASKDMEDKYLYKDGSRFENTKNKVAVDEFRFTKTNFVLFKGNKLSASTTTADLTKLFPNAIKNIGTMDVYGEGKLQVLELREDANNVSDGHIKIFIRNGKLSFMHWWFPC